MIKFKIEKEIFLKELELLVNKTKASELEKLASVMLTELKQVTPKDTGLAANSWEYSINKDSVTIKNSQEYLKQLNAGSSKQAPAFFIETTILNYGIPKGPVVAYE